MGDFLGFPPPPMKYENLLKRRHMSEHILNFEEKKSMGTEKKRGRRHAVFLYFQTWQSTKKDICSFKIL